MSTRSLIGIKDNKGITSVYCHFDGYLNGVGITLLKHYDTEEKIYELLERGDMSSLGEEIGTCEFYYQRGEDGVDAKTIPADTPNIKDVYYKSGQNRWADYVYLFEDGKWYYAFETIKRNGNSCVYDDNGNLVYETADWKLVSIETRSQERS